MKKLKDIRYWTILLTGVTLRVLPEQIKGQHRTGDIVIWLSAFPRSKA
jgi:hypothetical protein